MDNSGGFTTPPPPPPPPGGEGGAAGSGGPGLAPRGLGDILSAAFQIYRDNAANLLVIVAVVVVPLTFISAFFYGVIFDPTPNVDVDLSNGTVDIASRSAFEGLFVGVLVAAIGVIIWTVLEAALVRGAAQGTIGDPVDIDASYRWGFARFGSVLLVSILVGLAVLGGLILFIIPGIIFGVMFAVSVPALVVENKRGTEAMSRSWNLVKGHFWHALGVIFVAGILTGIVASIIRAIGFAIGDNWFVDWIFQAIAQIIVAPFSALVGVLLYLDLRARTESLTAEGLRAELAQNPT